MKIYTIEDSRDILGLEARAGFRTYDQAVAEIARSYLEDAENSDIKAERIVSDLRYLFFEGVIPNYMRVTEVELN